MRPNSVCLSAMLLVLAGGFGTARSQLGDEHADTPVCRSGASASRVRTACDEEREEVLGLETEITTSVELRPPATPFCSAAIELQYWQRDTDVHVEGVLDNDTCAASGGEYVIVVRTRSESGELQMLEFTETWQRDDDQPVALESDYPIGENVELIRLGSGRIRCRCADGTQD
jgi:hypothetical protein